MLLAFPAPMLCYASRASALEMLGLIAANLLVLRAMFQYVSPMKLVHVGGNRYLLFSERGVEVCRNPAVVAIDLARGSVVIELAAGRREVAFREFWDFDWNVPEVARLCINNSQPWDASKAGGESWEVGKGIYRRSRLLPMLMTGICWAPIVVFLGPKWDVPLLTNCWVLLVAFWPRGAQFVPVGSRFLFIKGTLMRFARGVRLDQVYLAQGRVELRVDDDLVVAVEPQDWDLTAFRLDPYRSHTGSTHP